MHHFLGRSALCGSVSVAKEGKNAFYIFLTFARLLFSKKCVNAPHTYHTHHTVYTLLYIYSFSYKMLMLGFFLILAFGAAIKDLLLKKIFFIAHYMSNSEVLISKTKLFFKIFFANVNFVCIKILSLCCFFRTIFSYSEVIVVHINRNVTVELNK